jgi:hypothetical protein
VIIATIIVAWTSVFGTIAAAVLTCQRAFPRSTVAKISTVRLTFVATFGSVGADSVTVRTAYLAAKSYSSTATNKVRSAPSARAVMG